MKDADLLQAADDYNSFYLRQGIEALIAERDAAKAQLATPPGWHECLSSFGLEAPSPRQFAAQLFQSWKDRLSKAESERDAALAMCAKLNDQAERAVQCAENLSAEAAGRRAAQPGLTYCAERAKPGGCPRPNVQCGWPACNAPPEVPRAPYEIPR